MADTKTVEVVYCGPRFGKGGVEYAALIGIDGEKLSDDLYHFAYKKEMRKLIVGGVYLLTGPVDEPSVWYTGGASGPKWLRRWHNQDDVAGWITDARAHEVAKRTKKMLTEERGRIDEAREALKPLMHDYLSTDRVGRLAREVVLLGILRGDI